MRPKPDRSGATQADPSLAAAQPVAPAARSRPRHLVLALSFVAIVLLPTAVAAWYLHARAVDQYASITAFSVRSEDTRSALDVLGRLGAFAGGGSASRDAEILHQFVQSQEIVANIDARLDLRALYSRHHRTDPVFGFRPDGTIEDLTAHWNRMLRIAFDPGNGLMELRALAFDPDEAQAIARAVLEESAVRINELAAIAREEATRHAREDLEVALERLRQAREAVTEFRVRTRIVDPAADIQGQMGLLNTLQGQLAAAMIDLDLLRETTREGDPRITQTERRIEVIRARIEEERARFGGGAGPAGEDFATVMAEFERLNVDREFAEQAYRSALSAFDAAVAEAQRNSIFLATHVAPTRAESARYPERGVLLALTGFFLFLGWSVGALIYYSVRDSR
ncbi:MAG: sugar transporter [Alkalilacustris sp.]